MNEINPNYAPWVKKMLVLKLFSPGSGTAWMDHQLLIHRERRGQVLGTLERETITEMRAKWLELALPYLESDSVSPSDKEKLRKDIEALKWAAICLDRLNEYDAQAWSPEAEPLEGDPASGENDEARRGATLEPAGNEKDLELQFAEVVPPHSVTFEVEEQSQPESALPPAAPLSARAQEDSEAPEPSTERDLDGNLFVQNPDGAMRLASFRESAVWLVAQCQAAYDRMERVTDLREVENIVHAQQLANDWAVEIKADQLVRDRLNAILVRSLRRLGQIRAGFRKNGSLKRGKGGKQLFVGLDPNVLRQSDKLARIEEDEDFEKRLSAKLKSGELTRYSTLQDPPAPKTPPESALFYRLMTRISDKFPFYKDGKYVEENGHEWAKCVMGGRREKIRAFAQKLIEALGPES